MSANALLILNSQDHEGVFGIGHDDRYSLIRWLDLSNQNITPVDSANLIAGNRNETSLAILFNNNYIPGMDFQGNFVQVADKAFGETGAISHEAILQRIGVTGGLSALMIQTNRKYEERSIPGDFVIPIWNLVLDEMLKLKGVPANRDGNPMIRWHLGPHTRASEFDQNGVYISLTQKLTISLIPGIVSKWAYINYLFEPVVGANGRFSVRIVNQVSNPWISVQQSTGQGLIIGLLSEGWRDGFRMLSAIFQLVFGALNIQVAGWYLLPGRQLQPSEKGLRSGTSQDVTLVLEEPTAQLQIPPSLMRQIRSLIADFF